MGVYIDIEMPKEGFVEILIRDDGTVQQTGQSYRIDGTDYYAPYVGEMPKMFTAIPVPPHGRLIDANSLENMYFTESKYDAESKLFVPFVEVASAIFDAPTIIPASKDNDDD